MSTPVRTALRSTIVVAALTGALTTAGSASAATTPHLIDIDVVNETHSTGAVSGRSYEEVRDGSIRVHFDANIVRAAGVSGCTYARATFTYADGGTPESKTSGRRCKGEPILGERLESSTSKDVVKYVIENFSATDLTAPGTKVSGSTFFVGDYPDSLGTRERLDYDELRLMINGVLIFRGSSDYSVQQVPYVRSWYVLDKVSGDLYWAESLPGDYAYVRVEWTYSDGTTSEATSSDTVNSRRTSAYVELTSKLGKEAVKVSVQVFTNARLLPVLDSGTKHFGDYRDR